MSPSKKKATAKKSGAKAKPTKSTKKPAAKKKAKSSKSAAKKTKPKKAAKAAGKAKSAAKKKAAKAAGKAKSAAKTTAKKAAKKKAAKAPAKKASGKKPAEKSAVKKAQKSPAQATPATPATKAPGKAAAAKSTKTKGSAAKAKSAAKETRSTKRARPRKPVVPTGPRHPKLGYKWVCFGCGAKFYDLGKEEPICPKCEIDQRERPPEDSKPTTEAPKAKVVRPMAQLLDYEEPVATRDEDGDSANVAAKENEMFDDAESDAAGLDIDDVDQADGGSEPPEIDAL